MCFRNLKHRPQQQGHTRPRQRVPVSSPNVVNNSEFSSRASNESDISEDSPQDESRYQRLHCGNTSASRMGRWSRGRDTTNKSREDTLNVTFQPPKDPKEVRDKANRKIDRALNHVPDVIHHNPKSKSQQEDCSYTICRKLGFQGKGQSHTGIATDTLQA
jgi:hypothetical protein